MFLSQSQQSLQVFWERKWRRGGKEGREGKEKDCKPNIWYVRRVCIGVSKILTEELHVSYISGK